VKISMRNRAHDGLPSYLEGKKGEWTQRTPLVGRGEGGRGRRSLNVPSQGEGAIVLLIANKKGEEGQQRGSPGGKKKGEKEKGEVFLREFGKSGPKITREEKKRREKKRNGLFGNEGKKGKN